jgi:hypothetical protein
LNQWQIKLPINGLRNVIRQPNDELTVENKVKFLYCETECVGSVIVDSNNKEDAVGEAQYLVDKALEKFVLPIIWKSQFMRADIILWIYPKIPIKNV